MKKVICLLVTLLVVGTMAFAHPTGCFEGPSRQNRGRCAIHVSSDELCVMSSDGSVLTRWKIISDEGSSFTVRSAAGAVQTVSYGVEDGVKYIVWSGVVFTEF